MLVVAAGAEANTTAAVAAAAAGAVDTMDVMVLFLDFELSSIDRSVRPNTHTHTLLRNVVDGVLLRIKNRTFCVRFLFFDWVGGGIVLPSSKI